MLSPEFSVHILEGERIGSFHRIVQRRVFSATHFRLMEDCFERCHEYRCRVCGRGGVWRYITNSYLLISVQDVGGGDVLLAMGEAPSEY
jgi:hypothetical protein